MKGIYLTEEGKQEIEAKIAELEEVKRNCKTDYEWNEAVIEQNTYKQILSSAIILPVEESWDKWWNKSSDNWFDELKQKYPQGIIIQPTNK
jgi:hypothetical protein